VGDAPVFCFREICTFGVISSSLGQKPLTTKWCYDPTQGDLPGSQAQILPPPLPPTSLFTPYPSSQSTYLKSTHLQCMSPRRNWDSPNPSPARECAPTPGIKGRRHTRLRVKGWGSPNSDDWRKSLALCLLCAHPYSSNRFQFNCIFSYNVQTVLKNSSHFSLRPKINNIQNSKHMSSS
jgi:hypothetical protein